MVETLRTPSTGLKQDFPQALADLQAVETLRKPSTGLKLVGIVPTDFARRVETLRKPSTGLKPNHYGDGYLKKWGRDTQKTQHGIETAVADPVDFVLELRHSENPARD